MDVNAKIAEFASRVGIMKPNAVKPGDVKASQKLEKLLDSSDYAIEMKIDGVHYKMIANRFFSKDNVEKTNNFPHLRDFLQKLGMQNLILDGEINYPGKTSQYCTHVTGASPSAAKQFQEQNGYIKYTIFDILRTPKGNWLLRNTYKERRKVLEYFYNTFVKGTEMEKYIDITPIVYTDKKEAVEQWLAAGYEGGVIKKLDSQYMMGKKPMWQWMKVKQSDDADLVVIGFEPAKVIYTGKEIDTWQYWMDINGEQQPVTKFHYHGWIGSIVFGAYVNGVMTRICTASGFPEDIRKDMTEHPEKYLNRVARVGYMERTTDGYPRHPVFKNMQEDKQPGECEWEF